MIYLKTSYKIKNKIRFYFIVSQWCITMVGNNAVQIIEKNKHQ